MYHAAKIKEYNDKRQAELAGGFRQRYTTLPHGTNWCGKQGIAEVAATAFMRANRMTEAPVHNAECQCYSVRYVSNALETDRDARVKYEYSTEYFYYE